MHIAFTNKILIKKAQNVEPNKPRVIVPAHLGEGLDKYQAQQLKLPSGGNVRGTPIPWDHPNVPDEVYHVTTNIPAVKQSGMLLAGGIGGLGGDARDQHVSMTTSAPVAHGLKRDMRMMANVAKVAGPEPPFRTPEREAWGKKVVPMLAQEAQKQGWEWKTATNPQYEHSHADYGLGDWTSNFFHARDSAMQKYDENGNTTWQHPQKNSLKNPLFFGVKSDYWGGIDPKNIDVVNVPKQSLNTGSLVTDFDLGQQHLEEIRHHGDIPVSIPDDYST